MSCDCVKDKNCQINALQVEKARVAWEANAEALAEDRDTWRERAEKAEQERDALADYLATRGARVTEDGAS